MTFSIVKKLWRRRRKQPIYPREVATARARVHLVFTGHKTTSAATVYTAAEQRSANGGGGVFAATHACGFAYSRVQIYSLRNLVKH